MSARQNRARLSVFLFTFFTYAFLSLRNRYFCRFSKRCVCAVLRRCTFQIYWFFNVHPSKSDLKMLCAGAVLESPRLAKSRACRRKMTPQNRGAKVLCFSTLTLKFSTRTPKVPFGPLGGASGIALFTARAPGGLRAPFFFSRGGSGSAPGRLPALVFSMANWCLL